jgi:hypothetical protein
MPVLETWKTGSRSRFAHYAPDDLLWQAVGDSDLAAGVCASAAADPCRVLSARTDLRVF